MSRGDSFAKFMSSTAGGTQGSSSYGAPQQNRPPVFGSTPETGGGDNFVRGSDDYNPNLNRPPNIGGSDSRSNEQKKTPTEIVEDTTAKVVDMITFGKPIKKLNDNDLKLILEQVKLYQEGMPNYFQGIPGAANFVKGIFNSMGQGLERSGEFGGVEGSPTLEGLEDFIRRMDPDSNMLDSFKQADPTAYLDTFGLPQTEAGLDFFANLSLDDDTVDKLTQQKIIEARERLAQSKESQDRASGIMRASSAPPVIGIDLPNPGVTPRPGPIPPENPILNPVMSQRDPFDLAQFYASLPQYTQQGVMSPSLMQYYRNLGLFPRS